MGQFQQRGGSADRGSEGKSPAGEGGKVPGWVRFIKVSSFRSKGLGSSFVANGAPLKVSGKGHGVINSEYQRWLPPASSLLLDFIVSIM